MKRYSVVMTIVLDLRVRCTLMAGTTDHRLQATRMQGRRVFRNHKPKGHRPPGAGYAGEGRHPRPEKSKAKEHGETHAGLRWIPRKLLRRYRAQRARMGWEDTGGDTRR